MSEFIAFILPPATALAGMRMGQWILGQKFATQFGFGFRFAFGLAVGMLVFSQAVLLTALAGIYAAFPLAWVAILWGAVEMALLVPQFPAHWKSFKFQPGHLWLLLLLPLLYSWWVFGRLSTLEGTLEYDANAFWVFKAKILFYEQGQNLVHVLRQSNLGYAHMDYPLLVPCLYTLDYGAVRGVDEFINKVWPFWMMVALCVGILSLAQTWKTPRLLPIAIVTLIAFLPATIEFIRNEGGTIPMVFYASLSALLFVSAIYKESELAPAALLLALAGCFSAKFEGIIYSAICSCVLLPFCLWRGWLKNKALWKSAATAFVCVLPYFIYRLTKPVPNSESGWLHEGMTTPHDALHRFPQVWFLNIFARFFSPQFFHWQAADEHLQWIGHWSGLGSLVNERLSVLPWLLVALLVVSLIYKSRGRLAIVLYSVVVLAVFTILAVVISCLKQHDLPSAIDYANNEVGRYSYPFFTAWFLGIAALWFADKKSPQPAIQPEKKPLEPHPRKPKPR